MTTTVAITFPDLSPAEASILAQELAAALAEDGVPHADITRQRASADAQDFGSIILVAAGAYLLDLAREAGMELVKGAVHRAGQRAFDAILRKWGTRAEVKTPSGTGVVLGERHKRITAPRTIEQAQTLADLKSLGVVLLGASTFPNYPAEKKLDNPAFKRSAELAQQLFSPAHTVFGQAHVLDLFDQDLRPDVIVDRIEAHVAEHPDVRDVVLYYCGHGDFLPDRERTYYLALKGTRPGRESATGLGLKSFRLMIEQQAILLDKRCTFILDCCFAGAAVDAFQLAGLDPMIEAQVRDLPSRGFALLTAADRTLPAMGRDGQGATMFTGALAEVLTGRGTPGGKQLSLGDLCAETARHIKTRHGMNGVVPQCHAPGQSDGDVSRVPMFVIGAAAPLASRGAGAATTAGAPASQTAPDQAGGGFFATLFGGPPPQPAADVAIAALKTGASLQPGQIVRDLDIGPEMVVVPAGSFMMGEPGQQHQVTIAAPLAVGKYAITFAEWDAAQKHPDWRKHSGIAAREPRDHGWGRGRRPVIDVSWNDAKAYAKWLSKVTSKPYRLLSEAEWEYCCRAGTTTAYSFGERITKAQAQFSESDLDSAEQTVEVGEFPANGFGLHDMHGNVWEWCADHWHDNYNGAPQDGSVWSGGDTSRGVLRGGSLDDVSVFLRSAYRIRDTTDFRNSGIGFRVVCPFVLPRTL